MTSRRPPPMRDARYAAPRYTMEQRADGSSLISNTAPYSHQFSTTNGPLDHWGAAAPNRLWLAERSGEGWRSLTFSEGLAQVAVLAGALIDLGIGLGDPVLILAANGLDHALVAFAAMRLGAPAASISIQYARQGADPARLAHAVAVIKPAVVFVDDVMPYLDALDGPSLQGLTVIAGSNGRAGHLSLDRLLQTGRATPDQALPASTAKLLLTSGSTGRPKAVICTHSNIASNAAQIAACFDDPEPPIVVNSAPWSHSLGANSILQGTLHRGGSLYVDAGQPVVGRFGATVRNLRDVRTTYHNMVPAGWTLLADALERDDDLARHFFTDVRVLQYGGAGLSQKVVDRIEACAVRAVGEQITFASGYGSTETGPTISNVHWPNVTTGLIGMPVPGTMLKLAPQDDKFEIRAKGPQISPGYYDGQRRGMVSGPLADPSRDEEGFHRLGDAGRLVDLKHPERGLAFDGRLVENFKLSTGAFVTAGALRLAALSAIGGAALDAVVCGEGQKGVGLLLFINPDFGAQWDQTQLRAVIAQGLGSLSSSASGVGGKVARALILPDAPDAQSGEITDKGYINQSLARSRRWADIERLFADVPDADVLVLDP